MSQAILETSPAHGRKVTSNYVWKAGLGPVGGEIGTVRQRKPDINYKPHRRWAIGLVTVSTVKCMVCTNPARCHHRWKSLQHLFQRAVGLLSSFHAQLFITEIIKIVVESPVQINQCQFLNLKSSFVLIMLNDDSKVVLSIRSTGQAYTSF